MRRSTIPGMVMVLALALTACAPAPASPTASSPVVNTANVPTVSVPIITGDTETAVVPPTTSDTTGTSTAEAASAPATSETPADNGPTTDTSVRISTSTSVNSSEPFLVDQVGRALYLYTADTQKDTSTCTDECLTQWQPVIVKGVPQAGNGINASMLGTIPREDGSLQAAYNGWPLYNYTADSSAGTTKGQGMDSAWFLVSGTGNAIQ